MTLIRRLYPPALLGGLGGLFGWLLFGVFGPSLPLSAQRAICGGGFLGGFIAAWIVSCQPLQDRSTLRVCRAFAAGVVLGVPGGIVGMWLGEEVNSTLIRSLIISRGTQAGSADGIVVQVLSRGLGWLLLGASVGLSEGLATRSVRILAHSTLGGAIGGLLGGLTYGLVLMLPTQQAGIGPWGSALGLVVLGGFIGAFSSLVQTVFEPACLRVEQGWQVGREYALVKTKSRLGRDEGADIPLFRDKQIEKHHATIHRDGPDFVLHPALAPGERTSINGEPVIAPKQLQQGDRIQLGGTVLLFQARSPRREF